MVIIKCLWDAKKDKQSAVIKSWKNFLALSDNKVVYVTQEEECWKLTSLSVDIVPDLRCSHEQADTRLVLHVKHSQLPFIVHADDTDVMVLLLGHSASIAMGT